MPATMYDLEPFSLKGASRCATRGQREWYPGERGVCLTLEYGEIISGGRGAETRLLPERKGRRTRCSQDPRGESWERSRNRPEPTGVLFSLIETAQFTPHRA